MRGCKVKVYLLLYGFLKPDDYLIIYTNWMVYVYN